MTITRTIKSTRFMCNAFDMEANEMTTINVVASGIGFAAEKSYAKEVKKIEKGGKVKVLNILSREVESGLYAMSEETFLMYAERIGDGR